jgi:hypothetical protein
MRPHPPHSRAHPDFTVSRLIPDALAVHTFICLGDPRLVLSFHRCSVATCRPLRPRGTPRLPITQYFTESVGLQLQLTVSAFPTPPHSDSGEGDCFRGLTTVRLRYDLLLGLPSLSELTGLFIQPTRTFTSELATVWSPAPSSDITTVPTGQSAPAGLAPARPSTSFTALTGQSVPILR